MAFGKGKADEARLMTVRLVAPHEHAGVELQPGAIIDVLPDQAKWLIDLGTAVGYQRRESKSRD